ncbi:MAG: hypothetical protein HFJ09_10295 [Lachnospiraceae bacterium]|nr:hypothetical protein [Lachnospiraceae bacterium]
MKKFIFNRFLLCGFTGWCLECFWTGLHSLFLSTDRTLRCGSSLWMFPIYGLGIFISPISKKLKGKPIFQRGSIYASLIFLVEYVSGSILRIFHACPWNYSHAKLQVHGLIRLDFAPLWFAVGLLYEKILTENHKFALYKSFFSSKKDRINLK